MYETKLISPDGEIHNIPYYEIGLYSEKICNDYIKKSKHNKEQFEQFSNKYTYFKPYFDFIIFNLGYKIINPFLKDRTIGYAVGNYFITKGLFPEDGIKLEKYVSVCDADLQIANYMDTSLREGFISFDGTGFRVNRRIDMGHAKLCELILNHLMIYSKEIYLDYINAISDPKISSVITRIEFYMVERLGFIHMCIFDAGYGDIIYNDKYLPKWFSEFEKVFKNQYEYVSFDPISDQINLDIEPINDRMIV